MRNDHQFVIELVRPGGDVETVPLTPDWEPALEWTRLTGLCAHDVWAPEADAERQVEPVWNAELGEPFVSGFRVHLAPRNRAAWSADFPSSYFADEARAAAARLVESGALEAGDRVVYRTMAFARSEPATVAVDVRFEIADARPPLPLRRTRLDDFLASSIVRGRASADDPEVLLSQSILDEATALTADAGASETGGVLIGHLHRDPDRRRIFVEVTAQIPARHTTSDSVKLTFTSETWTDARSAIALRGGDEQMLGYWHSHPAIEWCKRCAPEQQRACHVATGFLSADDRALHRVMFPRAYTVALVMTHTLDGIMPALFGWREGVLAPRGFRLVERASLD